MKHFMLGTTLSLLACWFALLALVDPLLFVGNKGENMVSIIDLETGDELALPGVSGRAPHEIAEWPDVLCNVNSIRGTDFELACQIAHSALYANDGRAIDQNSAASGDSISSPPALTFASNIW